MTTSLAQQLQGIRQATSNANFQKRKKVASFLFDAAEAADQDYEQVFAIASNGFDELITYDAKVSDYSRTIFADESRYIDRYTQTKEQNASLDKKLTSFIKSTAPFFLLRPLHKCLEWLIRRFDVHVHLAETLLLTYLPYHASPVFARLLTILELPPLWSFLGAVKKANEPPSISLLARSFVKNQALITIFISHVQSMVFSDRSFHSLLTMYADVSVRSIAMMRDNGVAEDDIISRFLEVVGQGLLRKQSTEYQVANYMIITVLSSARTLSSDVSDQIMRLVANGLTAESQRSGLLCLAQLTQSQEGCVALPPEVYRAIVAIPGSANILLNLGEKYRAQKLLTSIALAAVHEATPESLDLIQSILQTGRASITPVLAAIAAKVMASADLPEFRTACSSFFEDLQQQPQFHKLLIEFYDSLASSTSDLELALQITLDIPADNEVVPKLRRQSSSRPSASLEDELAELPHLPANSNYLSVGDVRKIINVAQMATSLGQFADVLQSPVINRSEGLGISFLVRTSLSSNNVNTQVCALKALSDVVRKSISTDYQALIPIVISLLSSKSEQVRREAVTLADILYEQSEDKSKKTIWGIDDVYGLEHTQNLKWLSSQEAHHFLDSVLKGSRNECLLDHKVIYRAVAASITTHGTKGKELSHKTAALHFLASHINSSPIQKIILKLLLCFDKVEESTTAKTRAVLPMLERWIEAPEAYRAQCVIELIDPMVIERLLVRQVVAIEHGSGTKVLLQVIKKQNNTFGPLAIDWLADGFEQLRKDTKAEFLRSLIEAIIDGPSQVSRQAHTSIDRLKVSTELFTQMFSEINLGLSSSRLSTPVKKQKKETPNASPDLGVRRFTHLLEVLEKDEGDHAALLPLLFGKLGDLVLIASESSISVNYTQQVLLSCMYPMVNPNKFDPSTCRIDILINCIRTSTSPQVHNRALLLVAALAEAAPEQVLHGVMPIFTFMGASILRQDDGFSAHVIESTIQRVVPPLLKSLGAETQSQVLGAAGILRSFVDAFPHIPKHRRNKLFVVLLQTMGEQTFLAPLLAILAEKRVQHSPKSKSGESQKSYLEFSLSLLRQFSVSVQLQATFNLVEIARSIPEADGVATEVESLLNYNNVDADYLIKLKTSIIAVVGGHFASRKVRSEFEIYVGDEDWPDKNIFINTVEALIKSCREFSEHQSAQEKALDALDRAITLLPVVLFRVVVHDLLEPQQDEYLRIKALEIIASRVSATGASEESAKSEFLSLVVRIASIMSLPISAPLLCSALQSLSTIGRKFGKADPSTFSPVVETVIGEMGLLHPELIVRVAAIECLTTLVVVLGPRILPELQRFMPIVLSGFAKISRDEDADLLPLATIPLLEALMKTMPAFMTPYTQIILEKSADFSFATEELTADKKALMFAVAEFMPTKNVLHALGGAWEKCSTSGKKPLMALVAVIENTIENSERKTVTGAAKEILALFLQALDFRRKSRAWDTKGLEQVEKRVIAAFLKVVLKLNDSTFRPLFTKLRDWALSEFSETDAAGLQCRRITFFNFFSQFTQTFKSIVLNYFNYVFEDIMEILQLAPDLTLVPRRLWIGIVSSLEHGFASDNEDFWRTSDKFDRLSHLLIENLTYAESYPVLLTLIPAIVELTAAAPSEDHFKLVNTQVLQLFRAESSAVRLAAVTTENKLSGRLGDEWLSMLPQTIPFIAETLEDEDEKVERQTHALAMTIESFLGESLDAYLR